MRNIVLVLVAAMAFGCGTADSTASGERGQWQPGKSDGEATCVGFCGGPAQAGCWCDGTCLYYNDCCPDYGPACLGEYDPCFGKSCGDRCSLCDPTDPDCFETAVIKACHPDGTCAPSVPICEEGYAPCDGKSCGDQCWLCAPDDPDCYETAVVKLCQVDGSCAPSVPECGGGNVGYDPCGGKSCGDECTICAPDDPDCFETSVIKLCQTDGSCAPSVPDC